MLLEEVGTQSLEALQQNSKTIQNEPLFTLCQKTLDIFKK
jgi:hypothetical protein